ncbi:hypothetical protein KSP40_PGU009874 [Platanthera guangdongensis]|uniref:Uncharacterized protein n=1 Tax=Platanthera guangdongensis TaxID=2320717 RepID=A0ABR2LU16_9ASPA
MNPITTTPIGRPSAGATPARLLFLRRDTGETPPLPHGRTSSSSAPVDLVGLPPFGDDDGRIPHQSQPVTGPRFRLATLRTSRLGYDEDYGGEVDLDMDDDDLLDE